MAAGRPAGVRRAGRLAGRAAAAAARRHGGTAALFLPAHKRLVACSYVDAPGVPAGWHREDDLDCRCLACAGWPAAAHVLSEDYLCMCDACQAAFDPPAFRHWLRVAESRNQVLGWGCKPPAPTGVAPWAFGYAGPAEEGSRPQWHGRSVTHAKSGN